MFGSKKVEGLETQILELKGKLEQVKTEKEHLQDELQSAKKKVSELEYKLANTDFAAMAKQQEASKAEYEGLKEMYSRKIQEFDNRREEEEQAFARKAALDRYNLENEIQESRQASQEQVADTVKTFADTYQYYLNQIKILMDALSNVAANTGKTLFSEPADDLKTNFGLNMVELLKAETDDIHSDEGDLLLIGGVEEAAAEPAEAYAEETAEEPAEPAAAEEPAEAAEEAPAETAEEAPAETEAAEAFAEAEEPAEENEEASEQETEIQEAFREAEEPDEESFEDDIEKAAPEEAAEEPEEIKTNTGWLPEEPEA